MCTGRGQGGRRNYREIQKSKPISQTTVKTQSDKNNELHTFILNPGLQFKNDKFLEEKTIIPTFPENIFSSLVYRLSGEIGPYKNVKGQL